MTSTKHELHETKYPSTFNQATRLANGWTKTLGYYYTAVKGKPERLPDFCWYVTNRFDSRIAK